MQKSALKITDILETKDRSVQVVLAATGKSCWLPRRHVEFYPGRVVLPLWLAQKILTIREAGDGKKHTKNG